MESPESSSRKQKRYASLLLFVTSAAVALLLAATRNDDAPQTPNAPPHRLKCKKVKKKKKTWFPANHVKPLPHTTVPALATRALTSVPEWTHQGLAALADPRTVEARPPPAKDSRQVTLLPPIASNKNSATACGRTTS